MRYFSQYFFLVVIIENVIKLLNKFKVNLAKNDPVASQTCKF